MQILCSRYNVYVFLYSFASFWSECIISVAYPRLSEVMLSCTSTVNCGIASQVGIFQRQHGV
ncbi:uncharacterized protein BDZ99DRAFT_465779 [Mytilinidion resinicola]|uniref:Uncharacterized protein n=1 Tax=Mytilinidion resinicola TaxID=574789 RepID=A0A6A6YE02_9PEZI|nr:uncharacterized protein BDZ99DRAFT_465779 [Mytilinidion resinicola]KAF2807046.1 hypothetical protein BDZ99DRAFT_465779 [Mytilinidion resinicola]